MYLGNGPVTIVTEVSTFLGSWVIDVRDCCSQDTLVAFKFTEHFKRTATAMVHQAPSQFKHLSNKQFLVVSAPHLGTIQ